MHEVNLLSPLMQQHNENMEKIKQDNYYVFKPTIVDYQGIYCVDDNHHSLLVFGSCDYLGFAQSSHLKNAAHEAIDSFGTNTYGAQIFSGNTALHEGVVHELENMFPGKSILLYPSGMHTNLGVLSTLFSKNDVIIQDRENHISLFHGAQLSESTSRTYAHHDLDKLKDILIESGHHSKRLVVTDGTFSSVGDIAKIPALNELINHYNALLYVDEAHSFGVNGATGLGVCEQHNALASVDILTGTFSKALGSVGGFVAASKQAIDFLRHHSPHYTSSRGSPPAVIAATLAGLKLLRAPFGQDQRAKLWDNIQYTHSLLEGMSCLSDEATSPIFSVRIGNQESTIKITKWLYEHGILVNPFIYPGVSKNKEQIRILVTALHTRDHLSKMAELLFKAKKLFT